MRKINRTQASLGVLVALLAAPAAGQDALRQGFLDPPQAARPQVWWHWMSGNVTDEGAQLDLAWMHRMGIGGVHAFSGGMLEPTLVDKPLPFMSPGWREAYRHAVATAKSYGMDVAIAGSPGWSETGGPWVAPEAAMKKYVWSELEIEGGKPFSGVLPTPPSAVGPFQAEPRPASGFAAGPKIAPLYRDTIVIAFPTPPAEQVLDPTWRADAGPLPQIAGLPADLSSQATIPLPAGDAGPVIEADFGRTVEVSALVIAADPLPAFEILASDDGATFRSVARFASDDAEKPAPEKTFAFPAVRARVMRVRFERPPPPHLLPDLPAQYAQFMPGAPKVIQVRGLRFVAGGRTDRFEAKAGFESVADFAADLTPDVSPGAAVAPGEVLDLTAHLGPDGRLEWTPPPGRWTVLRIGWSLTGQTNGPAEPSSTGLEVDKLDRRAVGAYVDKLLSLYRDDVGAPLGRSGIDSLLTDSWEAGVQNWTPEILADFKRLRGYDPTPWLPVLAGRVVRDAHSSDAFLYDFRQTLKDLVVENHYAVLAQAAHAHGMIYYTEVQGDTPRAISDGLTAKARADVPTGEFWYRPFATDPGQPSLGADLQEAASAAHLYGKPFVGSESMTVAAGQDPWAFSPAMLKPVADEIFALGVNRILVHDSHAQPFVDRKPGLELGFFGQFFNRNDTWAEEARPWSDYLSRTSFLLQQGHAVADVAYFYGEEKNLTELFQHRFNTDVPAGYGFDYVNPEALLTLLHVKDGRLVTESGMSYRVLYVPAEVTRMSLPVLERLDALVRAGAVLVSKKPAGGFGLMSPDDEVRRRADALWGPGDGSPNGRTVGQGRVYSTSDLAAVLAAEHMDADVRAPGLELMTQHRRTADADIYFVSNRSNEPVRSEVDFRVSDRAPEFWSAEDGVSHPLSYRQVAGATRVSLALDGQGAGFVVFRELVRRPSLSVPEPRVVASRSVEGPWDVAFEPGRGAPAKARFETLSDWSRSADPGIRYFSGAATYGRTLTVDPAMLKPGARVVLDLGAVKELAVVTINGEAVGEAWRPPYRVDVTGRLHPGQNRLEIKVVNLWPNRLIGDKQPGATVYAYAPQSPYTAQSPLLPSGLLGPVRLLSERAEGRDRDTQTRGQAQ